MLDGSTRRLTCLMFLLVLLCAPAALAKPPTANRDAPEATSGQDITDLGTDPTGRFTTAVVAYDAAKLNPGGLLPGTAPATTKRDIYVCDFGPANQPRAGTGCRGLNHGASSAGAGSSGQPQYVDVTSHVGTGGLTPLYAVAGPGDVFSVWSHSSDTARFARTFSGTPVVNGSVSPDGSRAVAALSPAGPNVAGRIVLYEASGNTYAYKWELNLSDSQKNPAKPTSLAFSRDGSVLVVGTTRGVLFLDPHGPRPNDVAGLSPVDTTAPVVRVALANPPTALAVGTADGVYYVPLSAGRPTAGAVWNRGVAEGVTDVAMSLDGKRFAAAAGTRIQFYRAIDGPLLAEQLADSYDAGARVADLAYSASGDLLVAVAGESVHGFGPARHTPIWSFKATDAARGALDAPLRKVTLSEGGERLVVAGRTKFMAYTNVVSASAAFGAGPAPTILPTTPLALSFTLTNTGSIPDNYTLVVKRPVGWSGAGPENAALDPDGSAVLNLTVEAPSGTAPGTYPVLVEVRSRAANGIAATAGINVSLPRAVVLQVVTAEDKLLLRPPTREDVMPVTVRNTGNAEGLVNMSALQSVSQGPSWEVRFVPEQVRIPPGGEQTVEMRVAAPGEAISGTRNLVTIRAREGAVEATRAVTAYVDADFGAELLSSNSSLEFRPGESRTLTLTIRNKGNTDDTFNVTYSITPALAAGDWKVTLAEDLKVSVSHGSSRIVSVGIRAAVAEPRDATLTLRAVSQGDPAFSESTTDVLLQSIPADATPDDGDGGGSAIPGPAPLVALAAMVAAGLVLRRRGGTR